MTWTEGPEAAPCFGGPFDGYWMALPDWGDSDTLGIAGCPGHYQAVRQPDGSWRWTWRNPSYRPPPVNGP